MNEKTARFTERLVSGFVWITGLCTFVFLGSIVVFLSLFVQAKYFDGFVKACCRSVIRSLFIRINIEGRDHIRPDTTYLFMSNHVNIFDVFILFGYIPTLVRGVELDDHFTWPFYGRIIRRLGMIPISHSNPRAALKSLNSAKEAIAEGTSILILPEGGRTLDGQFKPFMRGTFLLAKQAGVDIVPMAMIGAFEIKRKGSNLIRPGKLTLRFGEPIPFEKIKDQKTKDISDYVRQKMLDLFIK